MDHLQALIGTDINKYTITKYISSGSFGDVFEARNKKTDELVALKIPVKTGDKDGQRSVLDEARIYKQIANPDFGVANLKVTTCRDKKIIVMDLLGSSLEALLAKHKRFGLKTVISLAVKMIDVIKYIHSCGYIHRDLKPDNFAIGNADTKKLYCIDFGLAKKYLKRNREHIKPVEHKRFCGTARYASIAAHQCQEQGRKDDLECVGYILVYLYKGKLPWQNIKTKDRNEKNRLIGEQKQSVTEEELCKNMPKEFCVFLKYVRNMDFDEKPHYSALRKMFVKLYESRNYRNDKLEWE
uniref:Protein kinase domain-containing protein n=1 Tax=viral metagenome TaxID=1070528 RepID=A0A6C0H6J0_9ZZZZ